MASLRKQTREQTSEDIGYAFADWSRLYGDGGDAVLTSDWRTVFGQVQELRTKLAAKELELKLLRVQRELHQVRMRNFSGDVAPSGEVIAGRGTFV